MQEPLPRMDIPWSVHTASAPRAVHDIVTKINTLVAKTCLSVVLNKKGNINLDSPLYLTGQIKSLRHLARNQFQRELEQTLVIIKTFTKKYSRNTGFYLRYSRNCSQR